jgi:uncharacterized protein YcnI
MILMRSIALINARSRLLFVVLFCCALLLPVGALAHVEVEPSRVEAGSYQEFTFFAPNEETANFIQFELKIPEGLNSITPHEADGWTLEHRDALHAGQTIVWSGGEVAPGESQNFYIRAQVNPTASGTLRWDAVQRFADGRAMSWVLEPEEQPRLSDGSFDYSALGPYPYTLVSAAGDEGGSKMRSYYIWGAGAVIVVIVLMAFAAQYRKTK